MTNETIFGVRGGEGAAIWELSCEDKKWAQYILHPLLSEYFLYNIRKKRIGKLQVFRDDNCEWKKKTIDFFKTLATEDEIS